MINLGDNGIKLMLGNSEVSKAYVGTEQVYPNEQPYEGRARLTYLNGDVYEIEGSGTLFSTDVYRGITKESDPHYYTKIKSVEIGKSCNRIGVTAFRYCSVLTSVTIPNSVTSIGGSAFYYCSGLTYVTIPNSVTSIEKEAFADCTGLTLITCLPTEPPTLGSDVFYYTNNCPIYVPAESVQAYKSSWSSYASRIFPIP